MGYSPQQVRQMSMFQYFSALDGYIAANSDEEGLTEREKDDLWQWIDGG
jgi:hypothetical protein